MNRSAFHPILRQPRSRVPSFWPHDLDSTRGHDLENPPKPVPNACQAKSLISFYSYFGQQCGPPIFQGLFGAASLVSIALSAILCTITIVPLTLVLLELHRQRAEGNQALARE